MIQQLSFTPSHIHQKGVQLLELLIASLLGLALISGVLQVFSSSSMSQKVSSIISKMDQRGYGALDSLTHIIEHSGYSSKVATPSSEFFNYPPQGNFERAETLILSKKNKQAFIQLRTAFDDRTDLNDCIGRSIPANTESHMSLYLENNNLQCESFFIENGLTRDKEIGTLQENIDAFYAHGMIRLDDDSTIVSDSTQSISNFDKILGLHLELIISSPQEITSTEMNIDTTYSGSYKGSKNILIKKYNRFTSLKNG